jgi:hypothetical protein
MFVVKVLIFLKRKQPDKLHGAIALVNEIQ